MKPYHPNSIRMTGQPYWRMVILAWAGKIFGIQFHVEGLPFGGEHRGALREISHDSDCAVHNGPALPVGPCDCLEFTVTHPDGKVFYRNSADQRMPL